MTERFKQLVENKFGRSRIRAYSENAKSNYVSFELEGDFVVKELLDLSKLLGTQHITIRAVSEAGYGGCDTCGYGGSSDYNGTLFIATDVDFRTKAEKKGKVKKA